jgi:hypothetical protein
LEAINNENYWENELKGKLLNILWSESIREYELKYDEIAEGSPRLQELTSGGQRKRKANDLIENNRNSETNVPKELKEGC